MARAKSLEHEIAGRTGGLRPLLKPSTQFVSVTFDGLMAVPSCLDIAIKVRSCAIVEARDRSFPKGTLSTIEVFRCVCAFSVIWFVSQPLAQSYLDELLIYTIRKMAFRCVFAGLAELPVSAVEGS